MFSFLRRVLFYLSTTLAVALFLLAVGIWTLRIGIEIPVDYRASIESFFFERFNQQVTVNGARLGWRGYGPEIRLRQVRAAAQDSGEQSLAFKEVALGIDLLRSVLGNRPAISFVNLVGAHFYLQQQANDTWQFAGIPLVSQSSAKTPQLITERLGLQNVVIILNDIQIEAQYYQANHEIYHIKELDLSHRARRIKLAGEVELPPTLGRRIWVSGWIGEEILLSQPWHGDLFIEGDYMNLGYWQRYIPADFLEIRKGTANTKIWSQWASGQLQRARGEVVANQGYLVAEQWGLSAPLQQFSTQFDWSWQTDNWAVIFDSLQFQSDDIAAHGMHFSLQQQSATEQSAQAPRHEVRVARAQLEHLHGILKLAPKLAPATLARMNEIEPSGKITDGVLEIYPQAVQDNIKFSGRVDNLKLSPNSPFPGMDGIDARVVASASNGEVELVTREGHVWFDRLYVKPFSIGEASGNVRWVSGPQGIEVTADSFRVQSQELAARGNLKLSLIEGDPFLDFHLLVDHAQLQHLDKYIPLSPKAVKSRRWLSQAFQGGELLNGEVVVKGPVSSFPFHRGEGEFNAKGEIRSAALNYAAGFPSAKEIDAKFEIVNRDLEVETSHAKTYGLVVSQGQAKIANLFSPPLTLELTLDGAGPAADGFRYLTDTPLKNGVGALFPNVSAQGNIALNLTLKKVLQRKTLPKLSGQISLQGNQIHLPQWYLPLESLQGQLNFTESGVSSERLRGQLFGGNFDLAIKHELTGDRSLMKFMTQGDTEFSTLADYFKLTPLLPIQGKSDYQSQILISRARGQPGAHIDMLIESELVGVDIPLPTPLGKRQQESWPMKVVWTKNKSGASQWRATLGEDLHFSYDVSQLGEGSGKLDLPYLNVAEWQPFIKPQINRPSNKESAGAHQFRALAIDIQKFNLFGNVYQSPTLVFRREKPEWYLGIEHEEINGGIRFPDRGRQAPVKIRFTQANLAQWFDFNTTQKESKHRSAFDPNSIPNIDFDIRSFVVGERKIGNLVGRLESKKGGIHLSEFDLSATYLRLSAQGSWINLPQNNQQLDISLTSKIEDLGHALDELGIPDRISEGRGRVSADFSWLGPSQDLFRASQLSGQAKLDIKDGRLLNADPGPGKVLGVFSVSSIPRRLLLDFSDLFASGLSFDKAQAQIRFEKGMAETESFDIHGPAAQIEISGSTNLSNREFNQKIAVIPNIGGTLPVAGAIAGGPGLGVLLYLGQDLVNKRLGKIIRYELLLTGPWSQPQLERL